jgi:hypothetical protein
MDQFNDWLLSQEACSPDSSGFDVDFDTNGQLSFERLINYVGDDSAMATLELTAQFNDVLESLDSTEILQ